MKKKCLFIILLFVLMFIPGVVFAASPYEFSFDLVKCDPTATGMTAAKCRNNYLNGSLDSYIIADGGDLEPGSTVMLAVHLKLGSPKTLVALQTYFTYDNSTFTPVMNSTGTNIMNSNNKNNFPQFYDEDNDEYLNGWSIEANLDGEVVKLLATDLNYFIPLDEDLDIAYFFFKVNDDATPGSSAGFTFDMDEGSTNANDADANLLEVSGVNSTFSVYGSQSKDATLKTLTITNGSTTYALDPEFVPGSSTITTYYTVVPNNITSVDIAATANDTYATVAAGGLGNKPVNVGDNVFNISVTAQSGDQELYQVHVYRLSNDATLSNLTLTNKDISIGTFAPETTTYNGNVVYATSSTTVNATTTHENATVNSGAGAWDLSNFGATANTRDVVVHAENCNAEYASVPGNTCTTKTYTINVMREDPSTNAYLSDLTVDGSTVSGFIKTETEYDLGNVSYATTSINIGALVEDTGKANITSGLGNQTLNVGENTFEVVVTAEDGKTTETYTIKVYRLSNDTTLTDLSVTTDPMGTLSPVFTESFKGDYTYTYDSTVTSIVVSATANDVGKAYVMIADTSDLDSGVNNLTTSTNTFGTTVTKVSVVVTAEDGTTRTYPITLNRNKSSNSYLSDLSLSHGTLSPDFISTTKSYTAVVDASVTDVEVYATPAVTYGKVISITGNTDLQFGNNTIEVVVKAEDGTESSYFITLTRKEYDIATLSDLTVNGVTVKDFASETYEYTIDPVDFNTTSLEIGATPTNSYATVSGTGTATLNTGDNEIEVVVTSHDKNVTRTYTINVYREKNSDNSVSSVVVDGVVATDNGDKTYSVTLPNSKTTLTDSEVVVSISDDATITKDASINLVTTSVNEYHFTVKAENGDEQPYVVYVTRTKSNDTTLSKVTATVDGTGYYCLMEDGNSCTISVPVTTTSFVLDAVIPSVASISPANGQTHTMTSSYMSIELTVTAEDGTVELYTVNIERQKSSNSNLSDLKVDGVTVKDFAAGTQIYKLTVPGTTSSIKVDATVEDTGKATILTDLSNNFDLEYGENTIDVKVEAEDKTTKTYTLIVTRSKNIDATLSDLTVNGVTVKDFASGTYEYTIDPVDFDTTSLEIGATATDSEYATIEGLGDISLKTADNTIVITVKAHDTSVVQEYKIHVYRAKNSDNSVSSVVVDGVVATDNGDKTYSVTLPNSKTTLIDSDVAVTISDDATITKDPSVSLSTKYVNEYHFTVTSENGDVQPYIIYVTRTKSDDSSLSKVTLTIGDDSSRYCLMEGDSCTISVPVDTTGFSLSTTLHPEATVTPVDGTYFDMPSTESIKSVELTVTAEDGKTSTYTVVVERQKSSNNNLSDLRVDGVTVKDFEPGTQTYELVVDGTTDKVFVSATVEDTGKASIVTDLSQAFALDFDVRNKIEVTVTAEDGTTKTYTIYITRSHRTDPTLKDLTVNGVTIDGFDPEIYEYTLDDLPYNTHQLNIVATPNDEFGTKTGDGLVRVNTGDNTITITVTAHDTSVTQDYVIKVNRALNNDTSIKSITLAGVTATYNTSTKKYEVTVPNSVTEANTTNLVVEVNDPITELDPKATPSFTDTPLVTTATNDVIITVTAEDGTIKLYTLVVTREKSNVATLSSLTVTDGSFNPSFKSDTFTYDVTVPVTTEEFDVAAVVTEPHAIITSGVGHYDMTESTMTVYVQVTSEDLSRNETYTLNISRTKSSVNTLSGITVSEGTLSPDFDEETTSYTVNVGGSIETIDIGATLTDDRATILSGVGTHNLDVGENTITITVQSEAGSKLDYTVKVIRALKENNNLATLTVDGVSVPDFDKDTTEYILDAVPYSKTSIKIEATAEDIDATITGTGNKGLKTGENKFEVVVKAQNGTEKTYTIYITRTKNNNAKLSLLSVNGYVLVPTFDSDIYDYQVTVDSTKETLSPNEITAIAEDTNATVVKQELITLSTSVDNFYEVKVTAEDGVTTETYTIKVIRPKSSDASLKAVNVTGATISPTFASNKYEYTLTVPYGYTDFSIQGIPNNAKTNVFGNGDYTIANNVVTLTTQAEDGTTLIYTFTVVEALSNDATLSGLSVTGYPFDKTFQSTTLGYTIGNVPYGTSKLIVNATANNANSTVEYYVDGVLQDSNTVNLPDSLGTKTITVKVTAPDGIATKSYNISYTIVESSNAFLSNLVPSVGSIDFVKTTENYNLTVSNDVTSINFDIETEDSNASVTIDGVSNFTPYTATVSDLPVGTKTFTVLVTAHDGKTTKTYNVVIKRLEPVASDDAYLSSLSVKDYALDKTFEMETFEYSIGQIPFALTELTINATPNHGGSTLSYLVNGVRQTSNVVSIPKVEGNGAITVQVTAEDGTTIQNYKITYNKVASGNAYLESIIVSEGTLTFNKNTFAYPVSVDRTVTSIDITAKVEDPTATMQMNGTTCSSPHTLTLSPLASGDTEVVILVTAENGNVVTYKVTVTKEADPASTITSVEYGHTITNGYIKTVKLGTTGIEMKEQLDNENEYLEIWNADETAQVSDSDPLATGMIVKLMVDGVERDRKFIVIKGDTSGDGEIDLFDAVKILNHYLVRTPLTGPYLEAAYVNDDTDIDLFDSVMILNHYLGRISLH